MTSRDDYNRLTPWEKGVVSFLEHKDNPDIPAECPYREGEVGRGLWYSGWDSMFKQKQGEQERPAP